MRIFAAILLAGLCIACGGPGFSGTTGKAKSAEDLPKEPEERPKADSEQPDAKVAEAPAEDATEQDSAFPSSQDSVGQKSASGVCDVWFLRSSDMAGVAQGPTPEPVSLGFLDPNLIASIAVPKGIVLLLFDQKGTVFYKIPGPTVAGYPQDGSTPAWATWWPYQMFDDGVIPRPLPMPDGIAQTVKTRVYSISATDCPY